MRPLLERLGTGVPLVADGATGTWLLSRGLAPGQCPESINLSAPDLLQELVRQSIDAGAELVLTNTFGGSHLRLAQHGLEFQAEEINRAAVLAARRAAGDRAWVAGSIGPTGRTLKPAGELETKDLSEAFRRQVAVLAAAGVDLLLIETQTTLIEALLAVKAARHAAPDVPVAAAMTFTLGPDGPRALDGTTPDRAARELAQAGADLVGATCGNGLDEMLQVAAAFARQTRVPVLLRPNAGTPVRTRSDLVWPDTPADFAARAGPLFAAAAVVGGCCGTTPEHVRALRALRDARRG